MAEKPKKPNPKNPTLTDAERHERFVQMAREVGASDDAADFERAFDDVALPTRGSLKRDDS
jgi:hypothetical protein